MHQFVSSFWFISEIHEHDVINCIENMGVNKLMIASIWYSINPFLIQPK